MDSKKIVNHAAAKLKKNQKYQYIKAALKKTPKDFFFTNEKTC